ncbi:hypothetical protein FA95DRAFT_1559303 [Auriscalpium vulgare]|uniref:Uncharacterized protein n=1 Tax=Auriscalpium vulgare TaxID=40419 RepID=A0ACB8RT65_9AGAM|nr:hypothetical protein FA95DRAFT_1559303 [Auriscalpium vulgare]
MFQSTSQSPGFYPQDSSSDRNRPQLPHASSSSSMHGSQFTVAGLSSSANSTHGHPSSPWASTTSQGGSLSNSLSDSFLHSRSTYQPGYLMSMSQNNTSPQATPRFDELPVVQTKAKLNSTLSTRNTTSEFGKDPMFESSRQRQNLDEDAPPTASVNDIVNATYADSPSSFHRSNANFGSSSLFQSHRTPPSAAPRAANEPTYVIVFGYPADKFSVAVEYFKQFGASTEPDPNTEIVNCFRIGFNQPGDALSAVRKNGSVINGSWMVGVKWADPAQGESLLGQSVRNGLPVFQTPEANGTGDAMSVDEPYARQGTGQRASHASTPTVGTPIRLAPSASAYRKPGSQKAAPGPAPATPQSGGRVENHNAGAPGTPTKGIVGQFSDLVFGW